MEMEALQSILMDDLQELLDDRPEGWPSSSTAFRVAINPDDCDSTGENEYKLELVFAHTPNYPDEPPLYKARSVRGLSDADMATLNQSLAQQVDENLGMAMIYVLVSAAQEWLREKVMQEAETPTLDPEAARKAEEEAEERRLAEIRSHGTMITPQTFAEWKARFEAEMALERAKLGEGGDKKDKGLTGKQFFRQLEANNEQELEEDLGSDEDDDYAPEDGDDGDDDDEEGEDDDDDFLDDYLAHKGNN
ncbi:probable RWD domain-containing protein 1 [Coccomyxa sp. Obi]|nr:probable RWD domain-containing protein 1 [Coccomyxa sp. Obi]